MRTCSICKIEKNSADFKLKSNGYLSSFCKTCSASYQKEYQEKNKEKIKEKKKHYHTQTKEYRRWYTIKMRYGITKEEYEAILLSQNNKCAICENTKSGLLVVEVLLHTLGMYGKKASMERQNSNGLIKNFKRECQSENVSKALRITFCVYEKWHL